MRPVVLTVLLVLYAAFACLFAIWTAATLLAPASFGALPLPAWAMLLAAAVNGGVALGIHRRARYVRPFAIALHGLVAATAVAFVVLHVTGTHPDGSANPWPELLGKVVVHALVTLLWWRHRGIAAWLRA
ncbi:MAG: hypothetical protein JNK15_02415 [Planctomycetes bacterium]|nr:hypothetical protein [Planctomycetota bacterium]